ncbi:MAG TPA: hypothetical protein VJB15_06340 [Rhodothermia bacterium]|nr:hypothetical protein [Rhodothermia bacterium]
MTDKESFYKTVFIVGAWYDIILGAAFFLAWRPIYAALGIPAPDNASYIHIATAYIFVQGLGYWYVSRNLIRNLDLVRLGIVYKAIYVGLAVYYLMIGQLPHTVFAWFAVFDFIFLLLFIGCLRWAASLAEAEPARA